MSRTCLFDEHKKLNGRMVDFAGWELPVRYTSIIEEHLAVRERAGLFDISHMGEFRIKGTNAQDLLKKVIPTRLNKLEPGKAMYSCLCNQTGGTIDDLFIYMITATEFLVVVNAANIEKDFTWMNEFTPAGVDLINVSDETAKIDLQGPKSKEILRKVIPDNIVHSLKRFFFSNVNYQGVNLLVSNTGYTGELGYEFYLSPEKAPTLWSDLLTAGEEFGLKPAGLGARDSLRIEACYSLYGHELSDDITPVEAGLNWIISSKEDFVGKDVVLREKAEGAAREVVTLEFIDKGIPREGYRVEKESRKIGYITSGIFSPLLKKGIAMALVEKGSLTIDDQFSVIVRDKPVLARVVKRPFYLYSG